MIIRYEIITITATIIDQMSKFLMNSFNLEFEFKKLGSTKIKTAIKKIDGIISFSPILTVPKTFSFLEKFFNTRIRLFVFYFFKSF